MLDIQDKIQPMHSDMLKSMLGLNELPDFLLERYFLLKKMVDKVDGGFTPCGLVRIALDCGWNPETMKFEDTVLAANEQGFVHKVKVAAVGEKAIVKDEMKPEPEPEPEPEPKPEPEPEPEPETKKEALPIGRRVSAFFDGDIRQATINGSKMVGDNRIYSVLIDGMPDVIELPESDIEE